MKHFINYFLSSLFLFIGTKSAATTAEKNTLTQTRQHTEEIVYPRSYSEANNTHTIIYNLAIDTLSNNNCSCKSSIVTDILISGSSDQYNQLFNEIKKKNGKCKEDIIDAFTDTVQNQKLPKECFEDENKDHPVCSNMLQHMKIIERRFLQIVQLIYGEESIDEETKSTFCFTCLVNQDSDNTALKEFLYDIQNRSGSCLELNPGEEKLVRAGNYDSPDLYTIKREPDGSYSVILNLQFSADQSYDGPVPINEVPSYYMNKVKQCIKKANQKMLGPNGEKLNIVINTNEVNQNICEQNIKKILIVSKQHRTNSVKYASNIECEAITHEILHLIGLVDEYKDKHNCRVPVEDSIMSYHLNRWNRVFDSGESKSLLNPGHFYSILYGHCKEKNESINTCFKLAYEKNCSQQDYITMDNCALENKMKTAQPELEKLLYLANKKKGTEIVPLLTTAYNSNNPAVKKEAVNIMLRQENPDMSFLLHVMATGTPDIQSKVLDNTFSMENQQPLLRAAYDSNDSVIREKAVTISLRQENLDIPFSLHVMATGTLDMKRNLLLHTFIVRNLDVLLEAAYNSSDPDLQKIVKVQLLIALSSEEEADWLRLKKIIKESSPDFIEVILQYAKYLGMTEKVRKIETEITQNSSLNP